MAINRRLKKVETPPAEGDFIVIGKSIFGGERKFTCTQLDGELIAYDIHGAPFSGIKNLDELFACVESYEIFVQPNEITMDRKYDLDTALFDALLLLRVINYDFDVQHIIDELQELEI